MFDPERFVGTSDDEVVQELAGSSSPAEDLCALAFSRARRLFFQLSEPLRRRIVRNMTREQLDAFVQRMDPDEATDVLMLVDEARRTDVLTRLNERRREKVKFLLGFHPDSAGGIMDLDYVTIDRDEGFAKAVERVERFEERTGRLPLIFVIGDDRVLGRLPPGALVFSDSEERSLTDYMEEVPVVRPDQSDEEVIEVFRSNPGSAVAVVDEDLQVIGAIHAEDLLKIIQETAGETLYEFTGVAEEESVLDGPLVKIQRRYLWLILNLATAFLAASVVGMFEDTIQAFTLLAVYMPIVAGMGGNAGTQSMAVTVRGISLGQVQLYTGARVVLNEIIAGAANGAITGVLVAVIAGVFNQHWIFGGILAVSMVLNLIIAGFFGAVIPLLLDRFDFDPATSATIFITTATDVLGFFVFLWMAKTIL